GELSRTKKVIEHRRIMRVERHSCTDVGNGFRRSSAGGQYRAHVGEAEGIAGIERNRLLQLGKGLLRFEVDPQDNGGDLMGQSGRMHLRVLEVLRSLIESFLL